MTPTQLNDNHSETRGRRERLCRLYVMLSQINRAIVRAEDPYELYTTVCRIVVENGAFELAWVGLVDPAGQRLQGVAHAGTAMNSAPILLVDSEALASTPCPITRAIRDGRSSVVNDISAVAAPWLEWLAEVGMKSVAALPLHLDGDVVGVLVIATGEANYFKEAGDHILSEVAEDISFALGVLRREAQRVAAETKVQYLAYYDAQTGLPGSQIFVERLAAACEAAGGNAVAVMVIKLRRYHGVLQILGQHFGIELTRRLVVRLEGLLPTAIVARITESEFAFVVDNQQGLHQVEETAWRVHAALAKVIPVEGREIFLDPFIGISLCPRDGLAPDALKAALTAAAADPQDGSSCCRFYVADMDCVSRRKLDMEADLRRALERREFVLHYQPQLDLASGAIVGAEALIRWQRPDGGLVPPKDFIPLLEETGFIVAVGDWVLHEAWRCAKRWQDEGLPPIYMAVNLSSRQIQESDVSAMVRHALDESGLDPRWLELEITESIVLVNAEAVIRTLNELKACGVRLALDDFGTGYSSLSYLQRLPVERIKIDQSFVTNITSNPGDASIVRAVVGMAHSLGLAVIAEGVETEGQLGFLRGLQCEEMQGFYFSRAVPAEDFVVMLREKRSLIPSRFGQKSERVLLLVDDEPNVLSSLRRLMRHTGFKVLTTTSAKEGFELLAANPVGVVVCDQRMPEMTGTEFLRRVKELHPGIVRIILSGYTELNSVIDAVIRGTVYRFLTKPWGEDALMECLRDAFRIYEMEEENRNVSRQVKELLAVEGTPAQPPGAWMPVCKPIKTPFFEALPCR